MANVSPVLKPKTHEDKPNTGLDQAYLDDMAQTLSEILASAYQLMIKSHVYHWNVVGPVFRSLHELTEEHYKDLFEAIDVIAERIRALGHLAPASVGDASKFAPTADSVKHASAQEMVEDLIASHGKAVRAMRKAAEKAGEAGDVVTEDMLTQRLTFHEKALWMLRAIASQ